MFNNFFAILRCCQYHLTRQLLTRLNLPQLAVVAACGIALILVLTATWSKTGTAQIRPEKISAETLQTTSKIRPTPIADMTKPTSMDSYVPEPVAKANRKTEHDTGHNSGRDPRAAVGKASPNVPPVDSSPVQLPAGQLKGSAAFLAKSATSGPAGSPRGTFNGDPGSRSNAPPPGRSSAGLFSAPPAVRVARKPKQTVRPEKPIGKPLPESLEDILPGNSLYGHWHRPLQNAALAKIFFARNGIAYRQFMGEGMEIGQWRLKGKSGLCMFWPEQVLKTTLSTSTVNDVMTSPGLAAGQIAISRAQHCLNGRLVEEGYIGWQAMTKQRPVHGITVVRLGNMITDEGSVPGGYQPNNQWMLPYAEGRRIFGETIARILSF